MYTYKCTFKYVNTHTHTFVCNSCYVAHQSLQLLLCVCVCVHMHISCMCVCIYKQKYIYYMYMYKNIHA